MGRRGPAMETRRKAEVLLPRRDAACARCRQLAAVRIAFQSLLRLRDMDTSRRRDTAYGEAREGRNLLRASHRRDRTGDAVRSVDMQEGRGLCQWLPCVRLASSDIVFPL